MRCFYCKLLKLCFEFSISLVINNFVAGTELLGFGPVVLQYLRTGRHLSVSLVKKVVSFPVF